MTRRLAAGVGRPSESGSFHGSEDIGGHCVVYDGDGGTTGMEHGALMGEGLVVLGAGIGGANEVGVAVGVGKEDVGLVLSEPVGCRDRGGVPCPNRGDAWTVVDGCWLLFGRKLVEVWASVGAGAACAGRGLRGVWLLWRWTRRCWTRSSS